MRIVLLLPAIILLAAGCNGGGSSPTAVTPPYTPPPATASLPLGGTWTGSLTVASAAFSRHSPDVLNDDSCLLHSGGTQPGAVDSVTYEFEDGAQFAVTGTRTSAHGADFSLDGGAGNSSLGYTLAAASPELLVRCSEGSRFRLRFESGRGDHHWSREQGRETLTGEERLRYEVLRRSDGEHAGWLEQVVRVQVSK